MSSQVTLTGNLTSDPELKVMKSGSNLLRVGMAVNRRWKNKQDAWEEETSFFDINAWGELAENIAASLSKGTKVIVTGRLEQQTWEKDGQKQSKVVVIAEDIGVSLRKAQISGISKTGQQSGGQRQTSSSKAGADWDNEAPF